MTSLLCFDVIFLFFKVKELGAALYDCACAGEDLFKIFDVNWLLAQEGSTIPSPWPQEYHTSINKGKRFFVIKIFIFPELQTVAKIKTCEILSLFCYDIWCVFTSNFFLNLHKPY